MSYVLLFGFLHEYYLIFIYVIIINTCLTNSTHILHSHIFADEVAEIIKVMDETSILLSILCTHVLCRVAGVWTLSQKLKHKVGNNPVGYQVITRNSDV